MLTYLFKRLLAMVPTLLGITFVTFLIINLAPGDPVATSFGRGGGEGPSEGGGGDGNRDRLADAIRAKKKLLGMVREDHSVHRLDLPAGPGAQETPPIKIAERLGELDSWMRAVLPAPDGSVIFAGGDKGALVALDARTGAIKRRFEGHEEAVWALALTPDGGTLLSADTNGVLRSWDAGTGEAKDTGPSIGRPIRDLVVAGGQVLSASDDGQIRRHALPGLREVGRLEGHVSGVYALALSTDATRLYSGGYDRKLREWDLSTGSVLRSWDLHPQGINDLALSPDGARLATACDDRNGRILDLTDDASKPVELVGHYKRVLTVTWAREGSQVLTGSADETVRLWDATSGKEIAQSEEASGPVSAVALTPDGGALAAGESWVKVPIPVRYVKWLGRIVTFDFDRSFVDERPVIDKIADALPVTLGLNLLAILIMYSISLPLGVLAAVRRGSTFDHISSVILFMLYSIPSFWLATLLIMFLSSERNLDILPSVGLISDNADDLSFLQWLWDGFLHLILPITVMTYTGFASLSRYVRTSLLETIQEDYVRTARAKGLNNWTVIVKHAFRNSLVTIVTLVANLLPALIGGSVIVEYIFSIQGMGKLGFDAILARDYPVIMAITTFSAFLTLLGILLSDLLYGVVDPRVRVE